MRLFVCVFVRVCCGTPNCTFVFKPQRRRRGSPPVSSKRTGNSYVCRIVINGFHSLISFLHQTLLSKVSQQTFSCYRLTYVISLCPPDLSKIDYNLSGFVSFKMKIIRALNNNRSHLLELDVYNSYRCIFNFFVTLLRKVSDYLFMEIAKI